MRRHQRNIVAGDIETGKSSFTINYKTAWDAVRAVAKGSGEEFSKTAFDKMAQKERDDAAKKKK